MFFERCTAILLSSFFSSVITVDFLLAHEKEGVSKQAAETHHPANWRFSMPKGDVVQGKAAFEKFECYYCHEVKGESFPHPIESAPELSQMGPLHPPEFFAESIIHPDAIVPHDYRDENGKSPMSREHIKSMTLQELIDLSAYLGSLKHRSAVQRVVGRGRVIALVPEKGEIIIDHGRIDGFMDAMTMGYKVSSQALLKNLKPGDQVQFTIDKNKGLITKLSKLKN